MDKDELIKFLTSKEGKNAMKNLELEELPEIEVTDSDTPETIAKKFNAQLKSMQKNFQAQLTKVKAETIEEATLPAKQSKQQEIINFQKTHPGMSKKEVIDIMDPLYMSGKSLEDSYAIAMKSLDLNPTTGLSKEEEVKVTPPKTEKPAKVKSLKSEIDDDDDVSPPVGKQEAKSLSDIIRANANKLDAEQAVFKDEE